MATPALSLTLSGPSISGSKFPAPSKTFNGNRNDSIVGTIAAGTSDVHYVIAFPYATLQLLVMQASGGALVVKTNAIDATGGNTVDLVDKRPTIYEVGGPVANPLTHDVTGVWLSNVGAAPVDFEIVALNQVAAA